MVRGFTSRGQESGVHVYCSYAHNTLRPYHYRQKEAASLKVIGSLYSCLLIARLLSGSRILNLHLETIYSNGI